MKFSRQTRTGETCFSSEMANAISQLLKLKYATAKMINAGEDLVQWGWRLNQRLHSCQPKEQLRRSPGRDRWGGHVEKCAVGFLSPF